MLYTAIDFSSVSYVIHSLVNNKKVSLHLFKLLAFALTLRKETFNFYALKFMKIDIFA